MIKDVLIIVQYHLLIHYQLILNVQYNVHIILNQILNIIVFHLDLIQNVMNNINIIIIFNKLINYHQDVKINVYSIYINQNIFVLIKNLVLKNIHI